jgi:tetratricopeptide (TPR) repeat protein
MRPITFLVSLILLFAAVSAHAQHHGAGRALGDLSKVGKVEFATSCDPALQGEFEHGLALLHSFFYAEARRVFSEIADKDPDCAMAWWGVAMSYYHPLWAAPDSAEFDAGLRAARKAQAAAKKNERESGYVRAIVAYYEGVDNPASAETGGMSCHAPTMADAGGRAACFSREMQSIVEHDPEDVEAAAFFALSLLGTAPAGDPTLTNQKEAAALLETWFAQRPNHPGLAHYLIHSYDYPPLAANGLHAANVYADMAPWVPHALHMPSHIYTRVGMWDETIAANLASADASRRYAAAHHPDAASFEELHALDYLAYGYLQTARDAKAADVLRHVRAMKKTFPASDFAVSYAMGAIPARFALERGQWKEAASLAIPDPAFFGAFPFGEGLVVFARAVGAARSGDLKGATREAERLGVISANMTAPRLKYFAEQLETQRRAALALVSIASGEKDAGVTQLRAAAAREDSLGKHPVSPGSILPLRELLGDALLEAGRPDEALAEFEASLKIYPRRFYGIAGAARAAEAAGKVDVARTHYQELLDLAGSGDGKRAELARAKAFIKKG